MSRKSSAPSCVASEWFILMGYTMILLPILIKVAAINKITQHSRRLKNVDIDLKKLILYPLYTLGLVILPYLITWTCLDHSKPIEVLSFEDGVFGSNTINVLTYCSSVSNVWNYGTYVWHGFLLCSTCIIALQSLYVNVSAEMDESKKICYMVYSQFIFLMLRAGVPFLMKQHEYALSHMQGIISLLLSLDVITMLLIYMGPILLSLVYPNLMQQSSSSMKSNNSSIRVVNKSLRESRKLQQDSVKIVMNAFGIEQSECDIPSGIGNILNLRSSGVCAIKQNAPVRRK